MPLGSTAQQQAATRYENSSQRVLGFARGALSTIGLAESRRLVATPEELTSGAYVRGSIREREHVLVVTVCWLAQRFIGLARKNA